MGILIVDDSSEGRLLLSRFLESTGHADVTALSSARAAFQHLGLEGSGAPETEPDLILMDILMPDIDGIEACRRLKGNDRLRDTPIIMVTGMTETSDLDSAFSAGAMDYITKPVEKVELLARVNSALTLKREMDRRKARELELEESNRSLEQALREVKVLRGFIPICASCKKVRNEQGSWQQLEEYLYQHSEAEFSHGICQTCVQKLYPGVPES